MSGPIYRHDEPAGWSPPSGEPCVEEISAHIGTFLGPVDSVFHEVVSDTVHIDVHAVRGTANFPYLRLVTSGMSDLPMATPAEANAPKHAELMVTLPGDWKIDSASFEDECWYWPVRLLKDLARLPHKYRTWLGYGHSVPNGDPPRPYAPNTALCAALVFPPITVDPAFHLLEIAGRKTIAFYSVIPLHDAELKLKLRSGSEAVLERLARKEVFDIVDPSRRSVARSWFSGW